MQDSTAKQTSYKFQTIVATPEIRASFTQMRNELDSSDKELMCAIWKVVADNVQSVVNALEAIRYEKADERPASSVAKKAAKKAAKKTKAEKPEPKAKKITGNRPVTDVIRIIDATDDEPAITIADGRQ
jgi:hypothetical protein